MAKKLKKKNQNKFERDFKVELFFYNLPILVGIFLCVFAVAYIFNRYIEAVVFLTSFFILRYKFNTTFHYENVFYCICTTIALFTLSVVLSPSLAVSLLGCVLFAFLDTWALWFIQDRFEHKANEKYLSEKLHNDIYRMNESELRQFGASQELTETQQDILCLRVLNSCRICDICQKLHYSRTTIKYHLAEIKQKLNRDRI